ETVACERRTPSARAPTCRIQHFGKDLKSDNSCTNPKSQIGLVQFAISDFGFEAQESSDFKIRFERMHQVWCCPDPRPTERIRPSVMRINANNASSGSDEPFTVHTLLFSSAFSGDWPATVSLP